MRMGVAERERDMKKYSVRRERDKNRWNRI